MDRSAPARGHGRASLTAAGVVLAGAALACDTGTTTIPVEDRDDLLLTATEAEIRNGLSTELSVEVPETTGSILFEVRGDEGLYYLSKFTTPSGTELIEGGGFVTRAARELPGLVDWLYPNSPAREAEPGEYSLILRAEKPGGGHVSSENVEILVYSKDRPEKNGCGLHLDFLVDRDAVAESDMEAAIDGLVSRMVPLFAGGGIEIIDYQFQRVDLLTSDVDVSQAHWRETLDAVDDALAQARQEQSARRNSLHIVVARSLGGTSGPAGYSMGLPGPFDADRPNAAVIVASEAYVDSEGYLDLDGLSSTLSHEVGHYLGLYHTSEKSGELHDPIGDTPECSDGLCDAQFLDNIMTPGQGARRDILTEGQSAVIKRHPLCIPREVEVVNPEPPACDLECESPTTCAVWRDEPTCLVACDPQAPECPDNTACRADDVGTYVCAPTSAARYVGAGTTRAPGTLHTCN